MIIECENCNTKFSIADDQVTTSGRFLHCSICEHEWLYMPGSELHTKTAVKENSAILALNTRCKGKNTTKKIAWAVALFLTVLSLYYAFSFYSHEKNIFNFSENVENQGISIEHLTLYRENKGNIENDTYRSYLKIQFEIVNQTNLTKVIKRIKIVARDIHNKGIGYFRMNPNIELSAQNSYKVVTSIEVSDNPSNILIVLYDENNGTYQQEIIYNTQ